MTTFGGCRLSRFDGHDKSVHAHDHDTATKTAWIAVKPGADAAGDPLQFCVDHAA
jgi:hypothetical protein